MRFSGFFSGYGRHLSAGLLAFALCTPVIGAPAQTMTPEELARAGQLVRDMARAHATKGAEVQATPVVSTESSAKIPAQPPCASPDPDAPSCEHLAKKIVEIRKIRRSKHPERPDETGTETPTITPAPGQEVQEDVTGTTLETFDQDKNQIVRTTVIKKVERLPAPAGFKPPALKPSCPANPAQRSDKPEAVIEERVEEQVVRPAIPDSDWLQERAKIAPLPSRYPFHPERAVAIIPFVNRTKESTADRHVLVEVEKVFARLGFEIIPSTVVQNVMGDLHQAIGVPLNPREAARLAKALRARYLVTGLVHEYKTETNLRVGALLTTGIIGGGLTAYGKCRIESQLFDADRKRFIWENKAIGSAKTQLVAWGQGRDRLYDNSVQRAVRDVYQPLELLKTVPNNPSALGEFQRMRTLDPEFPAEWFNRIYR